MLCVLIRMASSRQHNIQFHDKMRKFPSIFVFFHARTSWGLKNEFELAMVNEPSVFELSRFNCVYLKNTGISTPY